MTTLLSQRKTYFPDAISHAAQAAEHATGCPTCVSLAQWAVESSYGRYTMGKANNPFGMKWHAGSKLGHVTLPTHEFVNGKMIQTTANFDAFPSILDAFMAHGTYLMDPNGWYVKAIASWKADHNWEAFIQLIGPIYATDPKYVQTLEGVINQFRLFEFDLAPSVPREAAHV